MTAQTWLAGAHALVTGGTSGIGVWVVTGDERLGGGGNGEVWRAEASDGRTGAVKVLHAGEGDEGQYRLARFKDEIGFLLAHPDFPGILPLLDSRISDNLDESSWYVMPGATPVRQALGADPGPDVVVGAAAEIADTLVALAAEGVAHRISSRTTCSSWTAGGSSAISAW